jgi:hypothetical protein
VGWCRRGAGGGREEEAWGLQQLVSHVLDRDRQAWRRGGEGSAQAAGSGRARVDEGEGVAAVIAVMGRGQHSEAGEKGVGVAAQSSGEDSRPGLGRVAPRTGESGGDVSCVWVGGRGGVRREQRRGEESRVCRAAAGRGLQRCSGAGGQQSRWLCESRSGARVGPNRQRAARRQRWGCRGCKGHEDVGEDGGGCEDARRLCLSCRLCFQVEAAGGCRWVRGE